MFPFNFEWIWDMGHAVFMGGIPEKSCLVLFNRPLRPEDFNMLWSACLEVSSSQPID